MHYAEQAAKAAGGPNSLPGGPSTYQPGVEINDHAATNNYNDPNHPTPNEFRARFHRPLVAPSPFRTFADTTTATTSTPTSTSGGSGPPSDPIDPHLTGAAAAAAANGTGNTNGAGPGTSESRTKHASSSLDPDLGQARGEAEGVVGRLERGS
jgi:hypothetical protein